ncbi:DinB family protein [Zhouia amylolytica]|uniref:DinB family protein n=1 Tax=Zhouia amylolytica TaxID=376730 RepID=UPI0020CDE72A|nr:DinB family protein [Zhouia amylolytica]MCQ0111497.1 DinB family protein [Zhouia amylolytica]
MKHLLILFIFFLVATPGKAQSEPISAFLEKWENSKNYLLEIAEAMPENAYAYKPTEREMTFAKQLKHIQDNMAWLSNAYFHAEKREVPNHNTDKKATIESLQTAFDLVAKAVKNTPAKELEETVEFFAGPKTKLQILNLLQDHVTHHRGQLIVYLNLNNIKPPRYVGW